MAGPIGPFASAVIGASRLGTTIGSPGQSVLRADRSLEISDRCGPAHRRATGGR